jgi:hypothetical protein
MAQPVFYQTLNMLGFDPTVYYTWTASITPETPAPPFQVGTQGFGSDGSQFVFVQASTSISLTDFVVLNMGTTAPYQANSVTNTNVASSLAVGLASSGLVLKQSVTYIPAGAYFWALTRGQNVPATNSTNASNNMQTNLGGVILYTTATAGILTSITAVGSIAAALAGIICVNSLTVSIPASIVPPAGGTQSSTGYTVGPVVNMNNPRTVILGAVSVAYNVNSLYIASF